MRLMRNVGIRLARVLFDERKGVFSRQNPCCSLSPQATSTLFVFYFFLISD
ncbi:hypothetical protein Hanom_Chr17g01541661 [Helianthus anomalus]